MVITDRFNRVWTLAMENNGKWVANTANSFVGGQSKGELLVKIANL